MGFDIHQFLAGARAMDQACQNRDIYQNPALLSAALKYVAAEKLWPSYRSLYALWSMFTFLI